MRKSSYLRLYVECELNAGLCFIFIFLPPPKSFHLQYMQKKKNSIWIIKIPATSVDKVTMIDQMHHWFISVRGSVNVTDTINLTSWKSDYFPLPSNSRFVSFPFSLSTDNVFWLDGWLFLSLKGRISTDRTVEQIQNARHLKICSSKQLKMNRLVVTRLRHWNITLAFTLPPFSLSQCCWETCCYRKETPPVKPFLVALVLICSLLLQPSLLTRGGQGWSPMITLDH